MFVPRVQMSWSSLGLVVLLVSPHPALAQCENICKPGEILVGEDATHCYCKTPRQIAREKAEQQRRDQGGVRNPPSTEQPTRPTVSEEWRQQEQAWTRLLNMRPSEARLNEYRARRNRARVHFLLQRIDEGAGSFVNFDAYAVEIVQLPPGMTATSLLDHIRRNLGAFVDPGLGRLGRIQMKTKPIGMRAARRR